MKSKDLKIIAVILAVALVFTVLASNAVSVASIVFLAKNELQEAPAQQTQQQAQPQQQQQQAQPQQQQQQAQQSVETTAPAGDSGSTATTPDANTGSTATTPDANKPADNNGGAATTEKTAKEVLDIYTNLMNKAKKDKPGFKKVEYQELPSDANSRVISKGSGLVGTLLNLVDTLGIMTDKATAEADPEIAEKGGEMRWFPVNKCEKGCYLTDAGFIKEHKYEDLGNGKARIKIVLKDEANPEPMAEGASTSPSKTGAMFAPLSKADIDETVNGGVVKAVIVGVTYSLTYHDCTAIVEYDTKTNEIIKLEQYMNVAISGGGKIFGVSEIKIDKQELINTMVITDFQY